MKLLTTCIQVVALLFAAMLSARPVQAQTCTVSATPVAFGSYDPNATLPDDVSGSVTVVCQATISLLVSYSIKLNGGAGGNIAARRMSGTRSPLPYQIYVDARRTTIWGDGTAGSNFNTGSYLLAALVPVTNSYTAYGRINASQNVYAGSYQDTLTILVSY